MRWSRKSRALFFSCFLALAVLFQAVNPGLAFAEKTGVQGLSVQLERLVNGLEQKESSKGIRAGIAVYNLTSEKYLYTYQHEMPFVPASNMKVWVSAAALDQLGGNYRFKTEMYVDGRIDKNGVLKGDVVLKGYGDPSLTVEDLQKLVDHLSEKGVKSIQGNLVMDETYFDTKRLGSGWMWDDEPYDYSAQISALALNRNVVDLKIVPDQPVGQPPTVRMSPKNDYVTIQNNVEVIQGAAQQFTVDRPIAQNTLILKGTMGNQAAVYGEARTVEDPALFAGNVLRHQLLDKGIGLDPQTEVVKGKANPKESERVGTHYSRPLAELTVVLNKESDNLYAEMFLKALGVEKGGGGSTQAGLEVVAAVMKKAGAAMDFRQADGSGLSRYNLISAEQMVKLLAYASKQDYARFLKESFPIAGVDGTLETRLKGTAAEGKVYAKTGSMNGVSCLSGYMTASNGDELIFSILLNGILKSEEGRDFQDEVLKALASAPATTASAPVERKTESYALDKVLNPLLQDPRVKGVTTGIMVKSLDRQQVLFAKNADKLLIPAGNVSLLTSSIALRKLGKDFQFKTELYATGPMKSGVLEGDLVIKGYGDPTLRTEDVDKMVGDVKAKGIKKITGNILVDDTYFDRQPYPLGWVWDQEGDASHPQIRTLGLDRGTVRLAYLPAAKKGEAVRVSLQPRTQYIQVLNKGKTVSAWEDNTLKIEKVRGENVVQVSGNLPISAKGASVQVPVHEPALYTGTVLAEKLLSAGISLPPKYQVQLASVPLDAMKVAEFRSPSVKDIVWKLHNEQNPYYAEMITKTLGAVYKGEGSTEKGLEVISDSLKGYGLNTHYVLVDGSGVTQYNLLSPRQVLAVLDMMSGDEFFRSTLPMNRLLGTPAEGRIIAQSGSLPGVRSLSGYAMTEQGEWLSFSIMMNGYAKDDQVMDDLQDAILLGLVGDR
ncbi:D-alanyl-D-alanine carboxypeptidase/D-alanyl-D-alanine-endopeptidase [Ammoniphilus sp. 3BR4]|uniref:D-alanyl-D-alanine carboxypeptidase/D-alanyl-D-alanine endopeptidase n=1 Tax=Ammoniphilus sp. 3BR4 TaxID=3158265 RepID=UPI00346610D8